MNQLQKIKNRNKFLQLVRVSNRHINCLRWGVNETIDHVMTKLELCWDLKSKKISFITEVIFNDKGRADILSLDDGVIFEIMKTEDIEKAKKKLNYYPKECKVIFVKCDEKKDLKFKGFNHRLSKSG